MKMNSLHMMGVLEAPLADMDVKIVRRYTHFLRASKKLVNPFKDEVHFSG